MFYPVSMLAASLILPDGHEKNKGGPFYMRRRKIFTQLMDIGE